MSTESVAQPARTPSPYPPPIEEHIEQEISRLIEKRPHLGPKIGRAASILVTHLSTPGKVIRARVGAGRPRFLVRSLNERGATYVVHPGIWDCTCPDHYRSGGTCKHMLACYVLWRVGQEGKTAGAVVERHSNGSPVCPMCRGDGKVYLGEQLVNQQTGELVERTTAIPCRRCKGGAT